MGVEIDLFSKLGHFNAIVPTNFATMCYLSYYVTYKQKN